MNDVAAWIERHAAFQPDKPAIVHAGGTMRYAELAGRVRRVAGWLAGECGLSRGDRVAWLGHNAPEQLVLLFACARVGCMVLPLNWRLSDAELGAVLADAAPRRLVVHASCAERAASLAGDVPLSTAGFDGPGPSRLPEDTAAGSPAARGAPDAPVLLVYTSGTTGRPKGAVLSQRALLFNALNAVHMHDLCAADVVLTVLPLFHVGGLNIQTLPALYRGATVVLESRFEPGATLEAIARHRPTLSVQVPATLGALLAEPAWERAKLDSLRGIATGSTDVPVGLIEAMHARGVPTIQVYGATETGPVAVYQRLDDAYETAGSIGRAGLHSEVVIADDHGNALGEGVPGEIRVRGPHVADGYWDRETGHARPFADGWFVSGDVAERDARGLLWFKDRIKHVIISGGENIYPAELERVLVASGLLGEAAVVGRPDARWGEVPVVVAVQGEAPVTREAVLALFEGALARYKHPKDVVFVDALPRTALGKVEVAALRARVRS